MMHRKELLAALLIIVGVTAFLVYTAAHAIGQILAFNDSSAVSTATAVDMSGWQTYNNSQYGFSVNYPQSWQLASGDPSGAGPVAQLGNPLEGTSTFALNISIANNSSSLSSGEYVHQFLSDMKAQDSQNASSGPAPQLAPQFTKSFLTSEGGQEAYELFGVFEYDHSAERIYIAHGTSMLIFDFPVTENNPNIASPLRNNVIAHEIVNTLTFTN
jgi:hypothetical protein